MPSLHEFLETYDDSLVHVRKQVELADVGALTAQTSTAAGSETVLFHDINGYPGWRLVDHLFVDRRAQARVLGCEPTNVVERLSEVLAPRTVAEGGLGSPPGFSDSLSEFRRGSLGRARMAVHGG